MDRLRRGYSPLAIHADDLLLSRDDSCLYDRRDFGRLDERLGGDAFVVQKRSQSAGGGIRADHAAYLDRVAERPEISRNIRRSTGIERLTLDFHDRHRCLRRNARDLSPDEFVQHDVADDQQPLLACLVKKVLYSFNFHLMMPALLTGLRPQREA